MIIEKLAVCVSINEIVLSNLILALSFWDQKSIVSHDSKKLCSFTPYMFPNLKQIGPAQFRALKIPIQF